MMMSLAAAPRISRVGAPLVRSPVAMMQMQQRVLSTSAPVRVLGKQDVKTVEVNADQDLKQINVKRNERPISPHLQIYQPQLSWLSSITHRFTGTGMSIGLYTFAFAYLAGPYVGCGDLFSSASLIDLVHQLPTWAKLSLKVPAAATLSYHFFNGLRHLSWDIGWVLDLRKSYAAGYTVIASTAVATVFLCML